MRLIDSDELIERTWRWAVNSREAVQQMVKGCPTIPLYSSILTPFVNMQSTISTIDSVEVVRCKNCKHAEHWYGDKNRCFLWDENGIDVFENGCCNYGKRRDEDDSEL